MNVRLRIMTKELARQYYSRFEMDPMLYMDLSQYQPYVYSPEKSDARVEPLHCAVYCCMPRQYFQRRCTCQA